MLKNTGIALAASLLLAGAAAAQTPNGQTAARAERAAPVSLAQMQARAVERFARLDANRDGQFTREEQRAGRQTRRAERVAKRGQRGAAVFARRDADRDGQLSATEAPRGLGERFAQLDVDRNGRLSPAEMTARRPMQAQGQAQARAPRDPARVRPDANRDGVITRAESDAQVRARFARLDADRNGLVTRDERRQHRQSRRG